MNHKTAFIIAHRGESFDAPENTMAAINLAWDRGARAVEIDIHLSKDNEIVVFHDFNTKRICGTKKIIKSTKLQELKQLDAGSHKGLQYKNERIPILQEVLKSIPNDGKLIIEIKSNQKILEKLKNVLQESDVRNNQIEIIAFNLKTVAKAKQMMPEYSMLWLLNLDYYWLHWSFLSKTERLIRKVKIARLNGVNAWAGKKLNQAFIEKFQKEGLLVYTWTVDAENEARKLINDGIDGITTNKAAWLHKQLKKH